jgi:hypothetical protein
MREDREQERDRGVKEKRRCPSLSISADGIRSFKEEEGDFVGVEVGGGGKTRKERGWR